MRPPTCVQLVCAHFFLSFAPDPTGRVAIAACASALWVLQVQAAPLPAAHSLMPAMLSFPWMNHQLPVVCGKIWRQLLWQIRPGR